jgi:hypothetical protein
MRHPYQAADAVWKRPANVDQYADTAQVAQSPNARAVGLTAQMSPTPEFGDAMGVCNCSGLGGRRTGAAHGRRSSVLLPGILASLCRKF